MPSILVFLEASCGSTCCESLTKKIIKMRDSSWYSHPLSKQYWLTIWRPSVNITSLNSPAGDKVQHQYQDLDNHSLQKQVWELVTHIFCFEDTEHHYSLITCTSFVTLGCCTAVCGEWLPHRRSLYRGRTQTSSTRSHPPPRRSWARMGTRSAPSDTTARVHDDFTS